MSDSFNQKEDKSSDEVKTILVLDDEPNVLHVLFSLLTEKYNIITASDGKSGLLEYEKNKPDLIITDIMMPVMNGLEFIKLIRKIDDETPILIISGNLNIESAIDALKLGADDYVTKPFNLANVEMAVEQLDKKLDLKRQLMRLNKLSSLLQEENERLKEQLLNLSDKEESKIKDGYKALFGALAHNLKGEFLHIGYSIKAIREMSTNSVDITDELDDSVEILEKCDIIDRSIQHSALLLRRFLSYIDLGKLQVEAIEIKSLIEKVLLLATPRLSSRIKLEIKVDKNIEKQEICVDAEQVIGVILELINNATKALHETGGVIELRSEEKNKELLLTVKDNGIGLTKEIKEKLFKETLTSKSGLGLGLYISKRIMKAMGGDLSLQRSSSKGAAFTITLPLAYKQKDS